MTSVNYDFIIQDFIPAFDGTSSENRYVLRKMLMQGIREAEYRSCLYDGDKASNYKRLMLTLESVVVELDITLDAVGGISNENRKLLTEAMIATRRLIDLSYAEIMGDYANIVEALTDGLSEDYCQKALAA